MDFRRLSPGLFCLLLLAGCSNSEVVIPATGSELDSFASDELGIIASGSPEPGGQAPDFALRNVEKEVVKLSDFRGQPVILNFFESRMTVSNIT